MNYNKDIPQNPKLIEPGVAYFLKQNLKQCKKQKYVISNTIFNLGAFTIFIVVLGGTLTYMHKGKLTRYQQKEKEKKTENYILTKLQNVDIAKKKERQDLITDLPIYHNNYFFK